MSRVLTRDQVRRVDELAVSRYAIPSLILMENAARSAAAIIDAQYAAGGRTVVLCGPGNNGGDGCAIARHLHNAGWSVRLAITAPPDRWTPDTATNFRIVEAMGLGPLIVPDAGSQQDFVQSIAADEIVIDALLGTGFQGKVRSPLQELIERVNTGPRRGVVAIDVPSGLDCNTGSTGGVAIRADLTITFVAAKPGLLAMHGAAYVGRLEIADIGVPRELIEAVIRGPTDG
jgi:NAD(P)H-hydrate epimerase